MKMCHVVKKSDKSPLWLLTVKVTPSMKSTDVYWTTLISSVGMDGAINAYVPCPFSGCDCPAGQNFCSHMLAVIFLLMIIQEKRELSYQQLFSILPKPVLDLQSIPVKVSFIYG
jgi:hypothetical protein